MSKRRPPTAGTFARLAVASAVACAVLPEIVDLGRRVWSSDVAPQSPASESPGPRVMGSLYTADDDGRGVDRFRFATGTPFDDDGEALDVPIAPARIAPEPPTATAERRLEEPVEPAPNAAIERADPGADVQDARPVSAPPPAVEAAAKPIAPPPATEPTPEAPARPGPAPAPVERGGGKSKAQDAAETGAATRDAKRTVTAPRAVPTARPSRIGSSRGKRRSASADGQDSASKAPWRPEHLTNWPE